MVDFEDITIEVDGITTRGNRKIVSLTAKYPSVTTMNIMGRALKTRARGRALIATGIVNTTISNIKALDIQRFSRIESFSVTERSENSETADIVVIVEQ
jgi:hypothetical protein